MFLFVFDKQNVVILLLGHVILFERVNTYTALRFPDDMSFPEGRTIRDVQREESERYLPKTVRTLRSRWKPDMNFGDFSNTTFAAFY